MGVPDTVAEMSTTRLLVCVSITLGCSTGPLPETQQEPESGSRAQIQPVSNDQVETVEPQGEPTWELPAAPVDEPPPPPIFPVEQQLDAPPRYELLAIRAALPAKVLYADLIYEGNNKHFRGPLDEHGLYRSGEDTAAEWRAYAVGTGGVVVLRDSLFSQQDHPTLQPPRALMMPPMWVSVAVAETLAGRTIKAPRGAGLELEDDAAWAGEDIALYFGSFPVSERLFGDARRALAGADAAAQAQTRNARRSMQMLAAAAQAMIDVAPRGAQAVASVGAEWIAASDRSYFGTELRRTKIIPIFVENPNEHESRDEGKGMIPWGVELPAAAVELASRAVYARRLADGPLALERYDLRDASERARAIALLEALVPRGSSGPLLYLWVNGGSDGHGKGEPATPHIPSFSTELDAAPIARERVVLFSKPSVRPRGKDASKVLEAAIDEHAKLGIPLSAQLRTSQLRALLEP